MTNHILRIAAALAIASFIGTAQAAAPEAIIKSVHELDKDVAKLKIDVKVFSRDREYDHLQEDIIALIDLIEDLDRSASLRHPDLDDFKADLGKLTKLISVIHDHVDEMDPRDRETAIHDDLEHIEEHAKELISKISAEYGPRSRVREPEPEPSKQDRKAALLKAILDLIGED
ncbi:MAG: hypothetical protein ACI8UO_005763 [Verrucomicrobiales bacterium]|jgi:hypothetical protein